MEREPGEVTPEELQELEQSAAVLREKISRFKSAITENLEKKSDVEDLIQRMASLEQPFERRKDKEELYTLKPGIFDVAYDHTASDLNKMWGEIDNYDKERIAHHLEKRSQSLDDLIIINKVEKAKLEQEHEYILSSIERFRKHNDSLKPIPERLANLEAKIRFHEQEVLPRRQWRMETVADLIDRASNAPTKPFQSEEDLEELRKVKLAFQGDSKKAIGRANSFWFSHPDARLFYLDRLEKKHIALKKSVQTTKAALDELKKEHAELSASLPPKNLAARITGALSRIRNYRER